MNPSPITLAITLLSWPTEYCQNPENEATHKIQKTLEQLRNDKDRDVGHFASYPVNTEIYVDAQDPTL